VSDEIVAYAGCKIDDVFFYKSIFSGLRFCNIDFLEGYQVRRYFHKASDSFFEVLLDDDGEIMNIFDEEGFSFTVGIHDMLLDAFGPGQCVTRLSSLYVG